MQRVIVIGGSGFLGQATLKALAATGKYEYLNIDIVPYLAGVKCKYVKQDIRVPLTFSFAPDDIVIHLAANQYHTKVPLRNRYAYFSDTNTQGIRNILERMEQCNAQSMIYFSTDMVYGLPKILPVSPLHLQNPFGPYGQSKKDAEALCAKFREHGFNITIFRPRMIVGPGRLGILTKLFSAISHNLPVPMIGNGNNCYQMVAVDDCAQAIIKAIDKKFPNKAYNLGSNNPPTVKELLEGLIKRAGSRSILLPTWGPGVKAILSLLDVIGLSIMYKEQFMIADQNYFLDITDTINDIEWTALHSDEDMIWAAFEQYKAGKTRLC